MKISIVKVVRKTYMEGKFCPNQKDETLLLTKETTVFVFGIPVYRDIKWLRP